MRYARRLFIAGSIVLMVAGLAHFWGQFGRRVPDAERAAVENAMRGYGIAVMGMHYTLMDVMQCWGVYFGILTFYVGMQNLVVARAVGTQGATLRAMMLASTACVLVLVGVALIYRIPPPMIMFALAAICFLLASVLAGKAQAR